MPEISASQARCSEYKNLPGFTYDRRWLISEYIFNVTFQQMLEQKATAKRGGKATGVLGSNKISGLSLTNPWIASPVIAGLNWPPRERCHPCVNSSRSRPRHLRN